MTAEHGSDETTLPATMVSSVVCVCCKQPCEFDDSATPEHPYCDACLEGAVVMNVKTGRLSGLESSDTLLTTAREFCDANKDTLDWISLDTMVQVDWKRAYDAGELDGL